MATAGIDVDRAAAAVRELLIAIGEDPVRDGLQATPGRVARMFAEVTAGAKTTVAASDDDVRSGPRRDRARPRHPVLVDVGAPPPAVHRPRPRRLHPGVDGRITGLSKLARLVDGFAHRLQVQERLTSQIANAVHRVLDPAGVIVVLEAEHLCMSIRGVAKPGATTVTSAIRGHFRDDPPWPGGSIEPDPRTPVPVATGGRVRLLRRPDGETADAALAIPSS